MANELNSGFIDFSLALDTNFSVFIERLPTVQFFLTDAGIPGVTLAGDVVATPYQDFQVQGNKLEWENLEIKFLIDEGFFAYEEVYKWMFGTVVPTEPPQAVLQFSDVTISALDNNKNAMLNFKFPSARPVGLSPIQYMTYGDSTRLGATVTMNYTYFTIERIASLTPPVTPAPPQVFVPIG